MNRKRIKSILKEKFEDFLSSIDDDKARELVKKNAFISGGAVASLFQNEKPKDLFEKGEGNERKNYVSGGS